MVSLIFHLVYHFIRDDSSRREHGVTGHAVWFSLLGNLDVSHNDRKRLHAEVFMILHKYFPDAVWYGSGQEECSVCKVSEIEIRRELSWTVFQTEFEPHPIQFENLILFQNREAENRVVLQEFKKFAATERAKLGDLLRGNNRPSIRTLGEFSLVPTDFINDWKDFVR